ncbi:MAG: DUF1489 domain-containing protein [Rhodospirillales bacterium]|jgi:hypothetical protein|nr:hypothetical protein [Rhodospirillaceae bacterium]MDP6430382.1 DUF1489 domain-containing protein [Rhodospirillales bacterium]MDP6646682.1 DUF1489 domain-containing protein [Rhodospirillales bacterium]MDP6841778.1 DUF1489 domain-containing protein [Rhodospirillales bacterium]|tara:strand:- start:754 stop:1188 length:435 start_codon:yes stop_codon:yes gene_type:complete
MTVHLLRMAVRVESIGQLRSIQAERLKQSAKGRKKRLFTHTRNVPRRSEELLDGGSIYWVVRRYIRVRQKIIGVEQGTNSEGRKYCAIELDPELVMVEPRRQKAFQGWRYFRTRDVPKDLEQTVAETEELPAELADELRDLGLI